MFIRNLKDILLPRDTVYVDFETKEYLQQHGFLPIGTKGCEWVFDRTETLIRILKTRQKEVGQEDAE